MSVTVQTIEIINWEKHNPRKDVKNPSWFRLKHSIPTDPQFYDFDSDEKWVFVCLFSLASVKNSGTLTLSNEHLSEYARVPVDKVVSALQKLSSLEIVTVTSRGRNGRVTRTSRARIAIQEEKREEEKREDREDAQARAPTPSGIPTEIKAEWEATLSHYGRSVNWARDEAPLMRAYLRVKDWLRVRSAIVGFRRETKSGDYDPAKHCHLRRLEDPKSFDFLEGLGDLPEGGATPKRDYSFLEDVS